MKQLPWLEDTGGVFPPASEAFDEPNGLLCAGGQLGPEILLSAYAHNDKILVKEGQSVKSTETISKLGSKETLYFEIRKDGYPVNPSSYIE